MIPLRWFITSSLAALFPLSALAGTVVMTWTPATQNTDGSHATVASYDIYRGQPDSLTKLGNTAATTFTDASAPLGTVYYALKSVDVTGAVSGYSLPLGATSLAHVIYGIAYDWRTWKDAKGTHAYVFGVGTVPLKTVCGEYAVSYDTRKFYAVDAGLTKLTQPVSGRLVASCR